MTTNLSIITDTTDRDLVTVCVIHESGILGNKEARMIRQTVTHETLHYTCKSPREALAKLAGELCTKLMVSMVREGRI
jgi:hypothetical protein